jgi:hypothetical protein
MTIITKASSKAYFTTGATPTQTQFGDMIDSYLGLGNESQQIVSGQVVFNGGFLAVMNNQFSGATYKVTAGDAGRTVVFFNSASGACKLKNDASVGFSCEIIQQGAGQITVVASTGGTLQNRSSQTKTAGQYAAVRVVCIANSAGNNAIFNLAGDTG